MDISITLPRSSVILDGSASTDDHGIISYYWQKLAPQSVKVEMIGRDSKVLSVSGLVEGTYIFSLTVSDKSGQRDQDSVTVLVYPGMFNNMLINILLPRHKIHTGIHTCDTSYHNSDTQIGYIFVILTGSFRL